jgi:hypothetical protein
MADGGAANACAPSSRENPRKIFSTLTIELTLQKVLASLCCYTIT